jgi:SP family xylose:H+ symportor-like MFS transporter
MMAVHVAIAQQLSGVNAINVYCGPILQKATSSVEVALLIPTLLGMVKFLGTLMTSVVISRFGRKTLVEVGAILLTIACVMMAVGFDFQSEEETEF